jgi:hypothetical protein
MPFVTTPVARPPVICTSRICADTVALTTN